MRFRLRVFLVALCAFSCGRAEAVPFSTFDVDAEAWQVVDLRYLAVGSPPPELSAAVAATHSPTGGNPNPLLSGHIFFDDASTNVFYFKAPAAFLGNQVLSSGGSLRFDLKSEFGTYLFNQEDVVLVGGGRTLVFDAPVVPNINWQTYTLPLSEGGWRIGSLSGPAASSADMLAALGAVTNLYIRGEFRGAENDIGRLDNVEYLQPAALPADTFAFPADTQGWTVVDLRYRAVGSPPTVLGNFPATWAAAGGNPTGHIFSNDPTVNVFYWSAPAALLGNRSTSYGASLWFDLKAELGTYTFSQEDVVLVGAGRTLVFDAAVVPGGNWENYRIGLTEAGWRVGSLTGAAATEADMKAVLGALTNLYIRGEFRGALNDIGRLDNVILNTVPAPTPPDLLILPPLPGDYNDDGKVNGTDYVLWRKNLGTTNELPNDTIGGPIGMDQYNLWRAHFGEVAGGGPLGGGPTPVPEPATLAIALGALLAVFNCRGRIKTPTHKF